MMQMLVAGGLTPLADGERAADIDNPRGYLEWERIKTLPQDPECIAEAEGKVVKVISQLLLALPATHEYRIVFMQRPLAEVLKSQDEMLRRRKTYDPNVDRAAITSAFQNHLYEVNTWLAAQANVKLCRVNYHAALRQPQETVAKVAEFVAEGVSGLVMDQEKMLAQVDPSLYRNKKDAIG